jgi:hypothetical protein
MLWVIPIVFGIFGLSLVVFPRATLLWLELSSNRPVSKVRLLPNVRWMGLLSLFSAVVFVVLILTGVLK